MANSSCVKCGSSRFEIKEHTPKDSAYKLMFVQCGSCGGVVGVLDYFNIGDRIGKLAEKLSVKL